MRNKLSTSPSNTLRRLASRHGVQISYRNAAGQQVQASGDTLIAILAALGVPIQSTDDAARALAAKDKELAAPGIEPVALAWNGIPSPLTARLPAGTSPEIRIVLETGEELFPNVLIDKPEQATTTPHTIIMNLQCREPLPYGYHKLQLRGHEDTENRTSEREWEACATLISAPRKTWSPSREKGKKKQSLKSPAGVFAPLHALHSANSQGIGNFSDLALLAEKTAGLGASLLATLPLLAGFHEDPCEASPYRPISRRFHNELFLDLARVPELQDCPEAQRLLEKAAKTLPTKEQASSPTHDTPDHAPFVDHRSVSAHIHEVLAVLSRHFFALDCTAARRQQFAAFLAADPEITSYAAFRATCARHGTHWKEWTAEVEQEAQEKAVSVLTSGEADKLVRYHAYVQWLTEEQFSALNKNMSEIDMILYQDLPIGVHPDGYDTWAEKEIHVSCVHVGAQPDSFFRKGQNWLFPPAHPEKSRHDGHRLFRDCLSRQMRTAGLLRIDHVMGLHRLYWIPEGFPASEGTYVKYPEEELYAVLCLESHRHKCQVVGENMGVVPKFVETSMHRHGLARLYAVQYELDSTPPSLGEISADMVAGVNSHDMPSFAGFWEAKDISTRLALGLLDETEATAARENRVTQRRVLLEFLHAHGIEAASPDPTETADPGKVLEGILELLAASPALAKVVAIEDLWLETAQQNMPGTVDEHANWRRKMRFSLEEMFADTTIMQRLQCLCPSPGDVSPVDTKDDTKDAVHRESPQAAVHAGPPEEVPTKPPAITATSSSNTPGPASASAQRSQKSAPHLALAPISNNDFHLFNEGRHFRLYEKLGAHFGTVDGVRGTRFAVWAPNARAVSVIGDFNDWQVGASPLHHSDSSGIWQSFLPEVNVGSVYKFHIESQYNDFRVAKADPFAFAAEKSPATASKVADLSYEWKDEEWMTNRRTHNAIDAPISIYEMHLGSWQTSGHPLSYREIAPELADYADNLGYTHVEILPLMEHPFNGSWGYQITGYFAATSRYGTPQDLMYLVDYLHQRGIGVILDWVPSHFPSDEHGLVYFDGTHLFEHSHPEEGFHPDWQSYIFNYGRNEVRAFLISSALFWFDHYHVDGLRVDGVASMLYRDYSRSEGEWRPNKYGGNENLEAIDFIRQLNEEVYREYPDCQTFAEESTAWPMVSRPTYAGGLGFGFKWDMGWMHDTLEYLQRDPIHRGYHHDELTFRMVYAFNENFVLSLSHDEVTHGKGSLLTKMPGDDWQKFANVRLLHGLMQGMPGKKLLFMGGEIGQWSEWQHDGAIDWALLDFPFHAGIQRWVGHLNRMYRNEPALYQLDCEPEGFEWIEAHDRENSVLSFLRQGKDSSAPILVVANCTPVPRLGYRVGVPAGGSWTELANSDAEEYGGSGVGNLGRVEATDIPLHDRLFSLELTVPPLGIVFFTHAGDM